MKEIRLYIEGGGDSAGQKAELRRGFDGLLGSIKRRAQENSVSLKIVCVGSRNQTFDAFKNARAAYPDASVLLLVDAEGPVSADAAAAPEIRVSHLNKADGWDLAAVDPHHVNLMVQCMETWIVADADALNQFYGQHFRAADLPRRQNLEDEPKNDMITKLKQATRSCVAGEYRKLAHASKLLQNLAAEKIKTRCPCFGALIATLEKLLLE